MKGLREMPEVKLERLLDQLHAWKSRWWKDMPGDTSEALERVAEVGYWNGYSEGAAWYRRNVELVVAELEKIAPRDSETLLALFKAML